MRAYYNEFNPESAAMLRQLIADGICAPGDVDERSITEVSPDDLRDYTQCHFFAGIGGWSIALRLTGWPDDRPVWTGSAPCQPFSSAGRQKGKDDERHLFPVWLGLIRECRPATIFGEQVASAVAHGWLDDVYQGLEAEGYAVGAAVLPACSVGAPHRRDRLWFVAHAADARLSQRGEPPLGRPEPQSQLERCSGYDNVDNTQQPGLEGQPGHDGTAAGRQKPQRPAPTAGFWGSGIWHHCPDQKHRLVEPSISLLANGVQHRRPIIHALGNAIVPQVAAEFIRASQG